MEDWFLPANRRDDAADNLTTITENILLEKFGCNSSKLPKSFEFISMALLIFNHYWLITEQKKRFSYFNVSVNIESREKRNKLYVLTDTVDEFNIKWLILCERTRNKR